MTQSQAAFVLLLASVSVLVAMACDVAVDMWWSGYKWIAATVVVSFIVIAVALFQLI